MTKQTMPNAWKLVRMGDYCRKPDYGYTASATQELTGIRFLRITDIQAGGVKWDIVPYCVCDSRTLKSNKLLADDIVIARIGATTGKAYLIQDCPEAVFASYLIRVRTNPELEANFLYYYFQSEQYWKQINENKGGRLKGGVNIPVLQNLLLPLPPLPEQHAIATILHAIQKARDSRRSELTLERERKAALMEDLFTCGLHGEPCKQTEIGLMPQSWDIVPISELFDLQQGQSVSAARRDGDNMIPFLRTVNVLWGRLDLSRLDTMHFTCISVGKLRLRAGDLLLCEGGEIGRTAIWNGEIETCCCQNHVHRLRARPQTPVCPQFYSYWMQTAFLQRDAYKGCGNRTTIPNLSSSAVKAFAVPFPLLTEQKDIAEVLTACDQKIAALEAESALHNELFRALLEELMSGRISTLPLLENENATIPAS